ncbi:MAG: hypothetical protein C4339_05085 [Nitrososphaerota archaeon]
MPSRLLAGALNFFLWGLGSALAHRRRHHLLALPAGLWLYFLGLATRNAYLLIPVLLLSAFFSLEALLAPQQALRATHGPSFCPGCGRRYPEEALYCPFCGTKRAV